MEGWTRRVSLGAAFGHGKSMSLALADATGADAHSMELSVDAARSRRPTMAFEAPDGISLGGTVMRSTMLTLLAALFLLNADPAGAQYGGGGAAAPHKAELGVNGGYVWTWARQVTTRPAAGYHTPAFGASPST
jgi:hypothetical protein